MVLATLSTAASFPWKGCAPFFLAAGSFLATAAFLSATGIFVLWARSCAGVPTMAAAKRLKAAIFNTDLIIVINGFSCSIRRPIATKSPRAGKPDLFTIADLPGSLSQQRGDVPGQVGREQRQRLALGAGQIGRDADKGIACDGLVENHFAGAPVARGHLRPQFQTVIAHGEDIARRKADLVPD